MILCLALWIACICTAFHEPKSRLGRVLQWLAYPAYVAVSWQWVALLWNIGLEYLVLVANMISGGAWLLGPVRRSLGARINRIPLVRFFASGRDTLF